MKQETFTLSDVQPRNTENVEWQIIADLLQDKDVLAQVLPSVKDSYFTNDGPKAFLHAITDCFNDGRNPIEAYASVRKAHLDQFNAWNEHRQLTLQFSWSTPDEVLRHIHILRTEAARRRCYDAALRLLQITTGNEPESEIYAKATDAVSTIEDESLKAEYTIGEVMNQIAEDVQQRKRDRDAGKKPAVATGFVFLDNLTDGGFKKGNLIILAARPSVGKTAVSIQMMQNAAIEGSRVAYFSIEMTKEEIGNRMIYSTDLVTSFEIWSGEMNWDNFEHAVGKLGRLPIVVNDRARDLTEIVSRMTILNKQGKCDIAFVDYLGLINPTDSRIPLYQQIAAITGTLKVTAKRLGIPVVLLCQLNREAAKDEEPQLYHLRDSGSIEQDADIVLMLSRKAESEDLFMHVRKNRHGEQGCTIVLKTNATRSHYEDYEMRKPI